MLETRKKKNQSNLNVFPTEKAILEELLHILTYSVQRGENIDSIIMEKKKSPMDDTQSGAVAPKFR